MHLRSHPQVFAGSQEEFLLSSPATCQTAQIMFEEVTSMCGQGDRSGRWLKSYLGKARFYFSSKPVGMKSLDARSAAIFLEEIKRSFSKGISWVYNVYLC